MTQAIMNKQMLTIYNESVDSDSDAKGKADKNLSEGGRVPGLGVPKKDGWGWEGKTCQHSVRRKIRRKSSNTYCSGSRMRNSKQYIEECMNLCRIAS
jgi:hypothetical protein